MKILWLCNVIPPVIAKQLNTETTVKEGWIDASLRRLLKEEGQDMTIGIACPDPAIDPPLKTDRLLIEGRQMNLYRFMEHTSSPWVYDKTLERVFDSMLNEFAPDIIHVFGTEYPHTLALVRACENKEKILVSIQGVMSACAENYFGDLPDKIIDQTTFRDWLKKDNIRAQQNKFMKRAEFEKETLEKVCHVTGRTEFDKNEVFKINPNLNYHFMNETLRGVFYDAEWKSERLCEHTIFVSQADYPLKGFHLLIEAMPEILKVFPDTHIFVAGNSITGYSSLKEKIKIGTYGRYLRQLMERSKLSDRVTVLGRLDENSMKNRYEESSVYVCTSYIENSPNSLGEAMLTGTPCIVPRIGGIPSMASDDEVMFFERGNSAQLAENIISLFGDEEKAKKMSQNSKKKARITHDDDNNFKRLLEIYKELCRE
ncbi:MAG: glycosyltransferase family 4 protein [Lachnospiraceae bacterium]|nr:glycosyltransferase family 4 protein [Lachnospiraceae bacterium]